MVKIDRQRMHDVSIGDLDLDGRLDVVGRDQSAFGKAGNMIYVYRQENPRSWKKHTISCPHGEGLKLGDIDQDGDADLYLTADGPNALLLNQGDGVFVEAAGSVGNTRSGTIPRPARIRARKA